MSTGNPHRVRGLGRRKAAWIAHGLLTRDGTELTPEGERRAEYMAEARRGYWDPPERFDDPGPDGFGWEPGGFPGGELR